MLIGVPLETAAGEARVALTPETAKKLEAALRTTRAQRMDDVRSSLAHTASC